MPIKHSLTTTEPVDNTRVVINPSKSPASFNDSKKLNDANNRAIIANAEAIYSVLRFMPYVKYLTDIGDVTGLNPAAKTNNQDPDITDIFPFMSPAFENYINKTADMMNRPNGIKRTRGKGVMRHTIKAQIKPGSLEDKLYRGLGKYNPLKIIGVVGDVVQGLNAAKELYNAHKNIKQVKQSINYKQQPFRIDTGASRENNESFNSKVTRPRHFLGGNY